MDNLKTGDILLFSGHTKGAMQYFSDMIKYGTHSNYSHVAMVLKDPTYFNLSLKDTLSTWTVMEGIVGLMGLAGVLILNIFV